MSGKGVNNLKPLHVILKPILISYISDHSFPSSWRLNPANLSPYLQFLKEEATALVVQKPSLLEESGYPNAPISSKH